jgi:uncharacterized protein YecT (DUF1311 family)
MEGCLEHKTLRSDARIRAKEQRAFASLRSSAGRRAFARGEPAWLSYREATCSAEASQFQGGSIRPAIYGACVADANRAHLESLAAIVANIGPH